MVWQALTESAVTGDEFSFDVVSTDALWQASRSPCRSPESVRYGWAIATFCRAPNGKHAGTRCTQDAERFGAFTWPLAGQTFSATAMSSTVLPTGMASSCWLSRVHCVRLWPGFRCPAPAPPIADAPAAAAAGHGRARPGS
jgi:hypothetical protein